MITPRQRRLAAALLLLVAVAALGWAAYARWLAPTRILVVNALPAQQADIVLSNSSARIKVTCVDAEAMKSLRSYDAVVLYARRIFLTDEQTDELQQAARRGVPIFTKTLRSDNFVENHNLSTAQTDTLMAYFMNESRHNFANGLRYLRHIATPHRPGDQTYAPPMEAVSSMYYHRAYGRYFSTADELTRYLKDNALYNDGGPRVGLISGITFPMEGNRQHIDTLISLLTRRGYNVYPFTATGDERRRMLRELHPDALVFMAMGRIGNDTLVGWLHQENIPLFSPFPLSTSHDEWMDARQPMSSGSKNARIVIPEIDGAIAPYCIATQAVTPEGYYVHQAEMERLQTFCDYFDHHIALRLKPNSEKRIAIGFFRRPGHDALLASGMEVIPSLYNLLKRLRSEGYDVSGLPPTLDAFSREIKRQCMVVGTYAKGAQHNFMATARPLWLSKAQYEQWAHEVLSEQKYAEVVARYGDAPGSLLGRGDSLAVACLRYGNVLLFPQPRPALGDDDFRVEHGVDVAPPHSYLAPYLYMQRGFKADALIHFGTHGNLEYTPGRDAAMRREDWSLQLIGPMPHFYFYTTGNIGEAIIAKRRSHGVLLTYLTPPYAESGMQQKYAALHNLTEKAMANPSSATLLASLKKQIVREGLHRPLGLDSTLTKPLAQEELERIDAHIEELMNERMQGAYYTLGQPYTDEQLRQTVKAMNDDPQQWPRLRQLLLASTQAELDNMVQALSGAAIAPAPGGDPVMNDNVLPTGRNMYSINPDNTPDEQAWEDGRRLAEETLQRYRDTHGDYPHKVSYTFWAGEFIATGGATIAQALWMLGVEPERDAQGRIGSLRLVPAAELGRPRIDVVVQVSGQLRDIADSRLKLITEAIRLASDVQEDSNYVREGTLAQERDLVEQGLPPRQARSLSSLRVFGPANNGYSTGMMNYIERSGKWTDERELVSGYLNNMCAAYGDDDNWGYMRRELFATALQRTDIALQPRQSNTWGPQSLDHVYEFTGALSLAVKTLTGKEPDAMMADYRNPRRRRLQGLREAIDVEARTTVLNPAFVRERMKGDEGTAQMFGETFRNIFGWNVTRPTALDPQLYDDLYKMYVTDEQQLGVRRFFQEKNPAAYQAMTATMLESARKGYWKATPEQLKATAGLHAEITAEAGAACTDFVCNNNELQQFVATQLPATAAQRYNQAVAAVKSGKSSGKAMVLEKQGAQETPAEAPATLITSPSTLHLVIVAALVVAVVVLLVRRRNNTQS